MSIQAKRKWFKKWHKWPSIVLSVFILFFATSGIILNHRQWFSGTDIGRKYIPEDYRYRNWNLASVKGSLSIGRDSVLVYGNIGVWLTDKEYSHFIDFNAGFPEGIDNRKINSLEITEDGALFAGTLFGLYKLPKHGRIWEEVALPVSEERVVKILVRQDSLLVMTRSNLLVASLPAETLKFSKILLPAGDDYDNTIGLFRTLWVIHSGEIYGIAGRLLVDLVGLVFIFLTFTGLIYFITPYLLKRMKAAMKSRWKRFNRGSLRWHNITGSWLILFLVLTTLTGMFLRPPLLIPIAAVQVGKIPMTLLDDANPWSDKLRDLVYDDQRNRYLLATSDGIYFSDDHFHSTLHHFPVQPPVSVMGINVFKKKDSISYLVGSFSGLYLWQPNNSSMIDYITREPVDQAKGQGKPFGNFSVAGYIMKEDGQEIVFDYSSGAFYSEKPGVASSAVFAAMPASIIAESPMSLWNLALEFHTCRIYSAGIGDFYILLIPLLGLGILFVLVTGFFSWYLKRVTVRKTIIPEAIITPGISQEFLTE